MSTAAAAAIKAAIAAISDPKARKAIGWTLVAILSPFILLIAFLCCLGSGSADHNQATVDYCFHGGTLSEKAPEEYRARVGTIRTSFALIDVAVQGANSLMVDGLSLDGEEIKSAFFALCSETPDIVDIVRFVGCFFFSQRRARSVTTTNEAGETTTKTEFYTVHIPASRSTALDRLAALLGRVITTDDEDNIDRVYAQACGTNDNSAYDGDYIRGGEADTALDVSGFTDLTTKNAHDLVVYVTHAWNSGWGYVWGTYGNVLTEDALSYKLQQYPDDVGQHETFIRSHWLGGRTADCVGLIKGYGWLDTVSGSIRYGTNGMPDIGANTMYYNAAEKGPIGSIPDIPGLAVWMDGHIGVYVGGGEVIEASGTRRGVVKTKLQGRGWTHWLKIPYINYD